MISCSKFVQKYTSLPRAFIREYFKFVNEKTLPTALVIDLDMLAKWLGTTRYALLEKLKDEANEFIEGTHYKIVKIPRENNTKYGGNNHKKIFISKEAFRELCMSTISKKGKEVKRYFGAIEDAFFKYRNELDKTLMDELKRLQNNQKSLPSNGTGVVYVTDTNKPGTKRLGTTYRANTRMLSHNSPRADNAKIHYLYKTDNAMEVEGCAKAWLKKDQYRKKKEVYISSVVKMAKTIERCDAIGDPKTTIKRTKEARLNSGPVDPVTLRPRKGTL